MELGRAGIAVNTLGANRIGRQGLTSTPLDFLTEWILQNNIWNDFASWIDTATWND